MEGELLKPHTISRAWRRAVVAKKLPAVTFHALRNTHASMLIRKGVDILTISRRLGHSKASVSLDVYGRRRRSGRGRDRGGAEMNEQADCCFFLPLE